MGILLGIGTALTASIQNTLFKSLPGSDPFAISLVRWLIAIPPLVILTTVLHDWFLPEPIFWVLLGISLPTELLLSYLYIRAFQISPQSVVGPLFSFSTIFLLPFGILFLGEWPSVLGIAGIASIAVGPFFLGKEGVSWRGWQRMFSERGSTFIFLAAFLAAVGVTITKFSFRYVPPLQFASYALTASVVVTTCIVIARGANVRSLFSTRTIGAGLAFSAGQMMHFTGLSLLFAVYFISLKRLSIVFDVFMGRFVHGEDHFRERLIGAVLMVAGVILIAIG